MNINGEKGQALPLVMLAVLVGAMIIPAFVGHADSSLIGSRAYTNSIHTQYALDSGVEHAIWNLTYGSIAGSLPSPGDTANYTLPETVNGLTPDVKIANSYQAIATDNFDGGTWSGGAGWLDSWTPAGDASIVASGSPYEGTYHLLLPGNTGMVRRSVNLAREIDVHLQFWAKAESFESGETAACLISSDNDVWHTVRTWTAADSDNVYRHYDIDLSAFEMTGQFWISFQANMGDAGDSFYIDDIKLLWLAQAPVVQASDDFESGDGAGGQGWVDDWTLTGYADVISTEEPHQGFCHLRLQESNAVARRSVDLSGAKMVDLEFWAKVNDFEFGDTATCRVSSDNVTWSTVYTWNSANSDNLYHFYSIDISSYQLSNRFWISFNAGMNDLTDYFYVDDLNVMKVDAYGITAAVGDDILKAVVRVTDGVVAVINWRYL
jgi:hypothetical protein